MKILEKLLIDYLLEELNTPFDNQDILALLIFDHLFFCNELLECGDEIVLPIYNPMSVANDLLVYIDIASAGDSIYMDVILNKLMSMW